MVPTTDKDQAVQAFATFHRVDQLLYPIERAADEAQFRQASGLKYAEPAQNGKAWLYAILGDGRKVDAAFAYFASAALLAPPDTVKGATYKARIENAWSTNLKTLIGLIPPVDDDDASRQAVKRMVRDWNRATAALEGQLKTEFGETQAPTLEKVDETPYKRLPTPGGPSGPKPGVIDLALEAQLVALYALGAKLVQVKKVFIKLKRKGVTSNVIDDALTEGGKLAKIQLDDKTEEASQRATVLQKAFIAIKTAIRNLLRAYKENQDITALIKDLQNALA